MENLSPTGRLNPSSTSNNPFGKAISPNEESISEASVSKVVAPAAGLDIADALPGEILRYKTFGTIYPIQYSRLSTDGQFIITNYKVELL